MPVIRFLAWLFTFIVAVVGLIDCDPKPPPEVPDKEVLAIPATVIPEGEGWLVIDTVDTNNAQMLDNLDVWLGTLDTDIGWQYQERGLATVHVTDMQEATQILWGREGIETVEPLIMLEAFAAPNDPLYGKQWHMPAAGAEWAWANTPMGDGIVVAVLDTGVSPVKDLEDCGRVDWKRAKSFVPGEDEKSDGNGHGTHCSGSIAQCTNNGYGGAGVAPKATIMPVKVLSSYGSGSSAGIAAGIYYAADNGAHVISMSLGGGYSDVIHDAVKYADKKGVIVVAAAGNGGNDRPNYPGALAETIGVSATGPDGKLAPYSTYGKGVDIAAPGGNKQIKEGGVWQETTLGGNKASFEEFQGTSMATPHVAGAVAILLSTGLDPAQAKAALLKGAKGNGEWDPKFGWGQLDIQNSVTLSGGGSGTSDGGWSRVIATVILSLFCLFKASVSTEFRVKALTTAVIAGCGFFFLAWLPLPNWPILHVLQDGLLVWPTYIWGNSALNFVWVSAIFTSVMVFLFGVNDTARPFMTGLALGVGCHLFAGAFSGSLPVLGGGYVGALYLISNAGICYMTGLGLIGVQAKVKK